jgi:hypothetical protein
MTETNAIGTGIGGEEYLNRPASSGRCSAVLELRVLDDQGRTLPAGERGELLGELGLDVDGIAAAARRLSGREAQPMAGAAIDTARR